MHKKKPHFNSKEKAIMKVLYDSRRQMTIREISILTKLSWVTIRKYLKVLREKDYVKEV